MALIKGWTQKFHTGNTNAKNMRVDKLTKKIIYRIAGSYDLHVYTPETSTKDGVYLSGLASSENNRNVAAGDGFAFVAPSKNGSVKRLDLLSKVFQTLGALNTDGSHPAIGYDPVTKFLFAKTYNTAGSYKMGSGIGGTGTGSSVSIAPSPTPTFSSLIASANRIWQGNAGGPGQDFNAYNPANNNWENGYAKPPVSCHANIGEIDNTHIMTIGTNNYVYLFDISGNKWLQDIALPAIPDNRDFLSIQWLEGYVYVMINGLIYRSTNTIGGNKTPTQPSVFTKQALLNSVNLVGEAINLSWGDSTDPDGDSIKYTLEFYNGSSWIALASNLTTLTYIHTLPSMNATNAQYRVKAVDSKGGESSYQTSNIFTVRKKLLLFQDGNAIKTYKNGSWQTV